MIRSCCIILFLLSGAFSLQAQELSETDFQLLVASYDGDSVSVARSLSQGADVNIVSYDGTTPLMLAAQNGHTHIVSLLIRNKATIDLRSSSGTTALIMAIAAGNIETAEFLIRNGANVQMADANGWSPLMHAIAVDSFYLPDMLLYYAADIDHADNSETDALMIACHYNRYEIAIRLLEAGADINKADSDGNTPLHYAINSGNPTLLDLLILNGADIDAKNDEGYTPLTLAVAQNRYNESLLLLSYGAEVNTGKYSSVNPLALATLNNNDSLINLLKVNGARRALKPDFSQYTFKAGYTFNGDDSRVNAGFGLSDPYFYWMPSVSYAVRPVPAFILEQKDTSLYYQYRERRHFISLDITKGLLIRRFSSTFVTAAYAGAGGVLTFGSFKGSSERPGAQILLRPEVGILIEIGPLRFKAGYEFLKLNLITENNNWFAIQLEVVLNNRNNTLISR